MTTRPGSRLRLVGVLWICLLAATGCSGGHPDPRPSPAPRTTASGALTLERPAGVAVPRFLSESGGELWALDDRDNSNLFRISGTRIVKTVEINSIGDALLASAALDRVWVLSTQDDRGLLSEYDSQSLRLLKRVQLPQRGLAMSMQPGLLISGVGVLFTVDPSSLKIEARMPTGTGAIGPLASDGPGTVMVVEDTAESAARLAWYVSGSGPLHQSGAVLRGALSAAISGTNVWIANTDRDGVRTVVSEAPASNPGRSAQRLTLSPGVSAWPGSPNAPASGHWWTYEPAASSIVCRSGVDGRALGTLNAPGLIVGPGQVAGPLAEANGYVYFAAQSAFQRFAVPPGCHD